MRSVLLLPALLLVSLAGCVPPVLPARTEGLPLPASPGVDHREGFFEGADHAQLFEQSWRPVEGAPKAVLVIVHGLKDHSSRYAWTAERLVAKGFAVRAFDLRGHGRSDGRRVYVDSFEQYLDDVDTFLARVRERERRRPVFLFGHSMGGAIVTLYALKRKPDLRGLVVSAPAIELTPDVGGGLVGATKVMGTIVPEGAVHQLDLSLFSRDKDAQKDNSADPYVHPGPGSARNAAELLNAMAYIREHMPDMELPLLAMHGSADKVTNPEGSKHLVERARSKDKAYKLYDGLYHDLLHEPEKERVVGDLAAWMDVRSR